MNFSKAEGLLSRHRKVRTAIKIGLGAGVAAGLAFLSTGSERATSTAKAADLPQPEPRTRATELPNPEISLVYRESSKNTSIHNINTPPVKRFEASTLPFANPNLTPDSKGRPRDTSYEIASTVFFDQREPDTKYRYTFDTHLPEDTIAWTEEDLSRANESLSNAFELVRDMYDSKDPTGPDLKNGRNRKAHIFVSSTDTNPRLIATNDAVGDIFILPSNFNDLPSSEQAAIFAGMIAMSHSHLIGVSDFTDTDKITPGRFLDALYNHAHNTALGNVDPENPVTTVQQQTGGAFLPTFNLKLGQLKYDAQLNKAGGNQQNVDGTDVPIPFGAALQGTGGVFHDFK